MSGNNTDNSAKVKEYENYLRYAKALKKDLALISKNFRSANKEFQNGGCLISGAALDNGKLSKIASEIDTIEITLQNIITKTNNDIEVLKKQN